MKSNPFFRGSGDVDCGAQIICGPEAHQPFPRVFIRLEALQTIKTFIDLLGSEINGFGMVKSCGNDFIIEKVFIIKQYVTGVHALTDREALSDFVFNLVKSEGDASAMKFQWHSHVDFEADFSPEDVDTIRGYSNDVMISLVMNQLGDYTCRVDLYQPVALSLKVPLLVIIPLPEDSLIGSCRKEITEKVIAKGFGGKNIKKLPVNPGSLFMEVKSLADGGFLW